MVQTTISADETTDVNTAIGELRMQYQQKGIAPQIVDALCSQLGELLSSLIASGKTLAAQGSQLKVTRELSVEGHSVKLIFGSGLPPRPAWRKFIDRLVGS